MPDPLITVCPSCQKMNRIPAARLAEKPNCGACGAALFSGHPVEVDTAGLDRHARGDLPVLVDVWAPWCGPCKSMAPQFEQAARTLEPDIRLLKLNSDAEPAAAQALGVSSIPALFLLRDGKVIARTQGAMPASQIVSWAKQALGQAA